jgi:hypothetical protein
MYFSVTIVTSLIRSLSHLSPQMEGISPSTALQLSSLLCRHRRHKCHLLLGSTR